MKKPLLMISLLALVATVAVSIPSRNPNSIHVPAIQRQPRLATTVKETPPQAQPPRVQRVSFFKRIELFKRVQPVKPISVQTGVASWYGEPQRTASGERFNPTKLTAAHRRLPLGTIIRVTNLANSRTTVVRINDRGPYIKGRILDLSTAAARELAMLDSGTTKVRVEVLPPVESSVEL